MSAFQFKVLQKDGEIMEGALEAATRGEATRALNEKGMQILSLQEAKGTNSEPKAAKKEKSATKKSKPTALKAAAENKLKSKHLIQFTEELSDLLSAGVNLDIALKSIGSRSETPAIGRVASECYEKVRDGVPLASALRYSSPSFNDLYCNLVSAGEVSGALRDILKRQVKYLTTLQELRSKLVSAMVYPMFLVVSGIGVSAMFIFFLLPRLEELMLSTGGELPPFANMMISAGDVFRANWIPIVAVLLIGIALLVVAFQQESTKRAWDEKKLKLPLFGKMMITRFNVQFVETLSNLLINGMPLVKAMQLVEGTTPNRYVKEKIEEITGKVKEGAVLNRCMENSGVFESGLIDMVRIGEDTGNLADSMVKAGDRLDREFSRSIERMAVIIQPAIILVMSLVVGVVAYMMISVIYETISVLREQR